tara:strand:- start:571 stop:1005 length:435 start_codon:yes stop_codon:yes gene_type:complete
MGEGIVDRFSIEHFLYGSLSFLLFKSINYPIYLNFIITNGFHLFMELIIENNISPTGKILESNINHVSDIIFFLLGWLIAFYFNFYKFFKKFPLIIKIILWIFLLMGGMWEIFREIYPKFEMLPGYENIFFNRFIKGAFKYKNK